MQSTFVNRATITVRRIGMYMMGWVGSSLLRLLARTQSQITHFYANARIKINFVAVALFGGLPFKCLLGCFIVRRDLQIVAVGLISFSIQGYSNTEDLYIEFIGYVLELFYLYLMYMLRKRKRTLLKLRQQLASRKFGTARSLRKN